MLVTITDASFAQESYVDEKGNKKSPRNHKAKMHMLCSPAILTGDECDCHIIGWSSTTEKRVSSSTMQAEGHAIVTELTMAIGYERHSRVVSLS